MAANVAQSRRSAARENRAAAAWPCAQRRGRGLHHARSRVQGDGVRTARGWADLAVEPRALLVDVDQQQALAQRAPGQQLHAVEPRAFAAAAAVQRLLPGLDSTQQFAQRALVGAQRVHSVPGRPQARQKQLVLLHALGERLGGTRDGGGVAACAARPHGRVDALGQRAHAVTQRARLLVRQAVAQPLAEAVPRLHTWRGTQHGQGRKGAPQARSALAFRRCRRRSGRRCAAWAGPRRPARSGLPCRRCRRRCRAPCRCRSCDARRAHRGRCRRWSRP